MKTLPVAVALLLGSACCERPVDRYTLAWDSLPGTPSFGSPFCGNGNFGAVLGTGKIGAGRAQRQASELLLAIGKNDFWRSEGKEYFTHHAGPTISLNFTNLGNFTTEYLGNASQSLGEATAEVLLARSNGGAAVHAKTIVGEGPNRAIVTSLLCERSDGVSTCDVDVTLRECCAPTGLVPSHGGLGGDQVSLWLRKENIEGAFNAARMASCSQEVLYYGTERQFLLQPPGDSAASAEGAPPSLQMANGSCLWVMNQSSPETSPLSVGSCSEPQGQWQFISNATAADGVALAANISATVAWAPGGKASGWCLSGAGLALCNSSALSRWQINSTSSFLRAATGAGGCLMAVPDNSNNTLATAALVVETTSGAPVKAVAPAAPVNASVPGEGIRYHLSLQAGTSYTVVAVPLTLRDIGCAGTREHTALCPGGDSLEQQATALAKSLATPAGQQSVQKSHDDFWAAYWNASFVDITGGNGSANATELEKWYYGMQYAFGSNVRRGAVTPSLFGLLTVTEPIDWNDQLTLDYNLESNYWGAASSNHPDMIEPYMATVSNPGLLQAVRERSTVAGVWNDPASVHWPGVVGEVTAEAQCGGAEGGVCHAQQDMGHSGGYDGASWPSTAFPLGDGRPAPTDLGTRFVGGLVATPLIQYFDHTMDMVALNATVYPIVRDNADFYASYATDSQGVPASEASSGASGELSLPYTCAQEACDCRNGLSWYWRWGKFVGMPLPNMTVETVAQMEANGGNGVWDTRSGEHNAHVDIAFASASFRKAIEYSERLGVDEDKRAIWQSALSRMPGYPTQTLHWVKSNGSTIVVGAELSGKPMLVEAQAAGTPALEQNITRGINSTGGKACASPPCSTIVWPTCNVEYPITNFAGMWPTDEIAHQDSDFAAAAKTTVYGLNRYTGFVFQGSRFPWANENGFGLSWPPGVRVSGREDVPELLQLLAGAAQHQTSANGIVKTGGGCLENMGATQAVNEMLLQSYRGYLSIFPVWSHEAGPASFRSLRAYGAFLVSASMDAQGTVGPMQIVSEQGTSPCALLSPWGGSAAPVVVDGQGRSVPVIQGSDGTWKFDTVKGGTYTVSPPREG